MEFIVPQFIERETKIIGPFTFKQTAFLGIAAAICIFLYFVLKPFWVFLIAAFFIGGGALVLTLFKLGGASLTDIIKNFFVFFSQPKIYLWRRKNVPPKIIKSAPLPEKEESEESPLKIAGRSHLGKLSTFLETKGK